MLVTMERDVHTSGLSLSENERSVQRERYSLRRRGFYLCDGKQVMVERQKSKRRSLNCHSSERPNCIDSSRADVAVLSQLGCCDSTGVEDADLEIDFSQRYLSDVIK